MADRFPKEALVRQATACRAFPSSLTYATGTMKLAATLTPNVMDDWSLMVNLRNPMVTNKLVGQKNCASQSGLLETICPECSVP